MTRAGPWASAFLAALALAAALLAYRLDPGEIGNPGPGFMPLATAALLGLMALGQLVRELVAADPTAAPEAPTGRGRWPAVLIVLAALAGFGRIVEPLGFAISTFLLLAVLFGLVARKRWWVALLAALLVAALGRAVVRILGVPLPEGPLGI
jgi:hypothetical protein